jgi:tetratricopeptide (TPR) repeat protein
LSKKKYKQNVLSAKAVTDLGLEFAQKGQLKKALAAFTTAIKLDRYRWEAYRFRGIVYAKLGRFNSALQNFDTSLKHRRRCAECFFERGTAKMLSGKIESALEDFSKCINIDPAYAPAYSSRAGILKCKGLNQKALEDIKAALLYKPQNPDYLHNRAVILSALGHYQQAIEDYKSVIKLDPKSGGTYNNLSWLLSTAKDPTLRDCKEAIFYARKALQLDKNYAWLDTLAAAHAECGNFEQAVIVETEAYKLSVPPNKNFLKRMELYKNGKTYADWMTERIVSESET